MVRLNNFIELQNFIFDHYNFDLKYSKETVFCDQFSSFSFYFGV